MTPLAIIGRLDQSAAAGATSRQALDTMVALLRTPPSFWIVIGLGILASPWLVRAPQDAGRTARLISLALAAFIFGLAVLALIGFTSRFIEIFADLLGSPSQLLIFPFVLGASPLGAALLVLAWYYVHPLSRLQAASASPLRAGVRAFTPMIVAFVVFGIAVVISVFIRLI